MTVPVTLPQAAAAPPQQCDRHGVRLELIAGALHCRRCIDAMVKRQQAMQRRGR